MKKFIILASLAAAVGFTACNSGAGSASDNGLDSLFSQSQADSLITNVAQLSGIQDNMKFAQIMQNDSTLSKDAFLKGVKYIMAADTTTSFTYGMYEGLNILGQLKQWEMMGLKVDRQLFLATFQKYLLADSISETESSECRQNANRLSSQLRDAFMAYQHAKLENSPESQENIKQGRAFIDSLSSADKDVRVLASGVAYKIEQQGEGDKLTDDTRAVIRYKARTLKGYKFDQTPDGDNIRPTTVGNRIPGLREALHNLSKGSKATIYIPGKEAYGVDPNRYNIGPNEMVIYDVEIVDVAND